MNGSFAGHPAGDAPKPFARVDTRLVLGLLLVGAAVRALQFGGRILVARQWDETQLAVPALHILHGGLPVNAGQEYFGAGPAYVLAAWFQAWGAAPLVLNFFGYALGLLVLWTSYLVARRLLDPLSAVFALAVLAVPPLLLTRWSFTTAPNHPAALILGNLCLLATHTLFFRSPGRSRAILVLGLLAGFGWWTDPLIVVYLAPFAVMVFRAGLAWRGRAWLFLAGTLVGGLPAWVYEVRHFPSTARLALHQPNALGIAPLRDRAATLTVQYLPNLLGWPPGGPSRWAVVFFLVSVPLWVVALMHAAVRDRGELMWTVGLGRRPAHGGALLWIVAVVNVGLVLIAARAPGFRYLLPLYTVVPCWIGETLGWLWRRRRGLSVAVLAAFLGLHLALNWRDTLGTTRPDARRWVPVQRRAEPVLRRLEAHRIDRAYWTDVAGLASYEITYLAGMRFVAADLWSEPVLADAHLVDAAVSPAIVAGAQMAPALRAGLQGLGLEVRETRVNGLRVFESAPVFTAGFVPLDRRGWTVTASLHAPEAASLLDGDAATGWGSGGPKTPGQWVSVDLGHEESVTRLDLLAVDWREVPAAFRVAVSQDGARWKTVSTVSPYWGPLFFSEHHAFLKVRGGRVQAIFDPVRARYLRIEQTGSDPYHAWSARELFVYGPGAPRPSVPRAGEVAAALRREGLRFVYANPWLSAWVKVDSAGTIGAPEANETLADYGQTEPAPDALLPVRVGAGRGILVGSDADMRAMQTMLEGQAVRGRETAAGPYGLLVFDPGPPPRRLDKRAWRATATENADRAGRAVDRHSHTAWISERPAGPGVLFTVDLGTPQEVRRVEVRPGVPGHDLRLWGSLDGVRWAPLGPLHWAGALYWTGSELLRNGAPEWAGAFAPISLRYLRLAPAAPLDRAPWTIAEIDAFE